MRDFVSEPRDRYELGLYEMDSELVYTRLARSVLPEQDPHGSASEQYENTYSRFHMSHIGMSSFDNVTLLLVKSESGKERLVWRSGAGDIEDAYFNEGEIERVFNDAILAIRSEIDAVKDV